MVISRKLRIAPVLAASVRLAQNRPWDTTAIPTRSMFDDVRHDFAQLAAANMSTGMPSASTIIIMPPILK